MNGQDEFLAHLTNQLGQDLYLIEACTALLDLDPENAARTWLLLQRQDLLEDVQSLCQVLGIQPNPMPQHKGPHQDDAEDEIQVWASPAAEWLHEPAKEEPWTGDIVETAYMMQGIYEDLAMNFDYSTPAWDAWLDDFHALIKRGLMMNE